MKILVIRLSSIGDIVLTSPVLRCLSNSLDAELHFVCKSAFTDLLKFNPHLDKVHSYVDDKNFIQSLKNESFDLVIDLHKNIRSKRLINQLGVKTLSYNKRTLDRWILVNFKIDRLKNDHVVDRYFEALKPIQVYNDDKGLEFFFPPELKIPELPDTYIVFVMGTAHPTKDIPVQKYLNIAEFVTEQIVLIGGREHRSDAAQFENGYQNRVINLLGQTSLLGSAKIIAGAKFIISPDTGMMHIAAALNKKIIAIYGSTSSKLGFRPYLPKAETNAIVIENSELSCRPCTKQGRSKCPKGHFKCMNALDVRAVVDAIEHLIQE